MVVKNDGLVVVNIAHGHQVSLLVMLGDDGNQTICSAGLAVENLALAVDDILLQIIGDGLAHAEILQCVGHLIAQLVAQAEKVVHCRAGS